MTMRFVTIFPIADNIHLLKDVGMIPFVLKKNYGYESKLVCIKGNDYSNNDIYRLNLDIEFINGDRVKSERGMRT